MCVVFGKQIPRGREAIGAVKRVVDVCTGKAICLRRFADHRAPRVDNDTRCVRGFGRIGLAGLAGPADPVVVPVDCPEDRWLPFSQGNDLGVDALELWAEDLRRRGRTGRVVLRPVGLVAIWPVARVVVTEPGSVVEGDADDDDVRIGKGIASRDIGFQFYEESVDLESGLGEVADLHRVAGCL
jgi:hypothetical protein